MRFRVASGIVLAAIVGCSNPAGPSLSEEDDLVLQILDDFDWKKLPDDAATITAAHVEGQVLFLQVQFGGGCGKHRLALVTSSAIAESNPPYSQFRLAHDGGGDPCDALITRELRVDLSPIVPLAQGSGNALRFTLLEPGEHPSGVGELLLTF